MRLTSQIKKLGAILQKLINLDKFQNENETNDGSLAMRIDFLTKSWARCNDKTETKNVLSQELEKWEKKAVVNSVCLKESY